MKRNLLIVGLILVVFLSLGSYYGWAAVEEYHPYFPLKPGNQWIYKMTLSDNSVASRLVGVSTPSDGKSRLMIIINKDPYAEIHYSYIERKLYRVKQITAFGIKNIEPMEMVLPAELKTGMSWSWEAADKSEKETSKVLGVEKVTVPAGTFEAVVVQCDNTLNGEACQEKTWFVKDIGYVKDVQVGSGNNITTELVDYRLAK